MEELVDKMKVVLASTFAAKLKAHSYHWNVIGPDFPQLHEFFATIYEDYDGAIDPLADHLVIIGWLQLMLVEDADQPIGKHAGIIFTERRS